MKKVFIGKSILFLASERKLNALTDKLKINSSATRVEKYTSKRNLVSLIDRLQQSQDEEVIVITGDAEKKLEKTFLSLFKSIRAAGGAVFNEHNQLLMIFRKGKWDLPKGKLDRGESIRTGALREIREETGVKDLRIISPIIFGVEKQNCTYHTYQQKGKRIINSTYWFKITSNDIGQLIPQAEEGIVKVEWCTRKKVYDYLKNSYHSIEEVVHEAFG